MRDIRKQLLCCCNTRFCKAVGNGSGAMMQITEDTPPDMLAGAMDLTVHLPNSQSPVKMAVNRSTPMMDLLIHVTTLHRLQPSSYIIEALAYAPNLHMSDQVLPYRPNTPIGALDTQHIRIIPKSPPAKSTGNKSITSTSNRVSSHQPFESTFRLQVHLPRNQLYVVRVSQHVMLENIMQKVCTEKNLDQRKYEFRHPDNLQERLDPKLSLADYQLTEVNVVQKGKSVTISDMAALQREEERRKQQTRNGGGVFNLIFKKRKSGTRSGSISSDTRSISPSRSDESNSRSITPPAIPMPQLLEKVNRSTLHDVNNVPKPPQRKRRPAPKPPIQSETPKIEETYEPLSTQPTVTVNLQIGNTDTITDQVARDNNGQTIYHSRNSSDSSGYHEASILSDTINMHTLPRRNKNCRSSTSSINQIVTSPANECTQSTSNLTSMENHSKSTSVINFSGTKKKRAPPPPTIKMSASASNLSTPVVASVKSVDSIPMPDTMSNSSSTQILTEQNTETSSKLTLASPDSLTVNAEEINPATVSLIIDECKTRDLCANIKEERVITPSTVQPLTTFAVEEIDLPRRPTESPINIYPHADVKSEISTEHIDADWQYQLPAPPTEFRDFHPNSLTMTDNYETISIHGLGNDSSNTLQEQVSINSTTPIDWRSETATIVESDIVLPTPLVPSVPQDFSDGSANILSGYHSLDILEKRQSQFLEKQLAGINFNENHDNESNTHLTTKYNINREFKEGIENYKNTENNQSEKQARFENKYGTLPNFKITTYSEPKKVVNIFENVDICSQAETKLRSSKRCSLDESKYVNDSKLFSGVSERNMNVLNTIQSETPFKKPVVVEIKSKVDTVAQHPAISNMSLHKANAFAVSTDNLTGKFSNIHRSDSLRINDLTSPDFNPVKRSKSHISLMKNKPMTSSEINYENNKRNHSNPLNVSECLQSLQVMRTILPKISNSPPSHSPEENIQTISKPEEIKEPEHPVEVAKVYRYSPPSINLGTWSERPKSQVSLKQDRDYKIGGAAVVREKTMNLSQKSVPLNSVASDNIDSKLLRLDATSQMDQVSVKNSVPNELGNQNTIPTGAIACDIKQLINHTTPTGFKRSHLSADKTVRPHSISFDTYQDLSRVPIVRSVELKKSYRNFQNSGSQSISDTQPTKNYNSDLKIQNRSRDATDSFRRGESVDNNRQNDNYSNKNSVSHRLNSFEEFKGYNINRGNSFLANRTSMPMPVVKGFRSVIPPKPNQNTKTNDIKPSFLRTTNGTNGCDIDKQNRETRPETNLNSQARNSENKYASVTVNSDKNAMDNNQTMVSRNGSHNLNSIKNNVPAPPIMPKVNSITSKKFPAAEIQPRDQLLEAIRNFGKNSLKHVRH